MDEWWVCTQDGQRLAELHPADARRFCDTTEHSLRVIGGNLNTLHADVDELTDSNHSHADQLRHRHAHHVYSFISCLQDEDGSTSQLV